MAAVSIALAGCGDRSPVDDDSSPTPAEGVAVTTPAIDECEAAPPPNPTPSDEGVVPRAYPPYPADLTAESAVTFATEYERAYRHNEILAGGAGGTDTILVSTGVPSGFLVERPDGFLVGVTATVDTEDNRTPAGGTAAPSYSDEFASWYLLTGGLGLRGPDLEANELPETPPDSVDLSDATVIHCG